MILRSRSRRWPFGQWPWPRRWLFSQKGHLRFGQWQIVLALMLFISFMGSSSHAAKLAEKGFEEEGRQVTMDFRDVEIDTLIKFIGELTGKNFVVDERVKGKVTVISPTKITVPEAYKVFESILEVHGYATVPAGKVIKVLPATEARGKSITTTVGTQILPSADTMITQIIPIRYANVNDVKTLFIPLVSKESLLVAYQPTNTLIVTDALSNINRLLKILKELDQELPRGQGNIHVYYLQNAGAEDLAKILTGIAKEAGGGGKAGAQVAMAPLPSLGEKISILADKTTNALIITASPQDYAVMEEVIKKLDIARAQVYVEALIAEVTLEKVTQLGVEWNWTEAPVDGQYKQYGQTNFGMLDALQKGALNGLIMGVSKGMITTGGTSFPDLKALVQFYGGDTDVNVLSAPRLLTTDNQEAQIIVGEERPFLKSSQLSEAGSTLQTWDYKDVGITMKITPHISRGTLLRLDIFAEIKSFVEDVKGLEGASITTKRQATTEVVVEDGSTVVIAGLIRDDKTGSIGKIPILGDIPLLGWLFKNRSQTKTKTNLLIFITPHIVTSAEDLRKITEEEQERRKQHVEEHKLEQKKTFPLFEDGD
jgi:general secretion pathway protein D